jgi:hypothetical protein
MLQERYRSVPGVLQGLLQECYRSAVPSVEDLREVTVMGVVPMLRKERVRVFVWEESRYKPKSRDEGNTSRA